MQPQLLILKPPEHVCKQETYLKDQIVSSCFEFESRLEVPEAILKPHGPQGGHMNSWKTIVTRVPSYIRYWADLL